MMSNKQGFSLVELSVVLIVLALLTGGILGGQTLIRAAELRSVGEEYEQWRSATNRFIEMYGSIPGDMPDATNYWNGTWNGNGDGAVDDAPAANVSGEIFTFWQHLAKAGMINGEYTGLSGSGSGMDSYIGINVPGSKLPNAGWSVWWVPAGGAYTTDWYDLYYGNTFEFGAKITNWEMGARILTPEEAWGIDKKYDDGHPAKGNIIARYWNNSCAEALNGIHSASNFDARYKVRDSSVQCALAFRDAF